MRQVIVSEHVRAELQMVIHPRIVLFCLKSLTGLLLVLKVKRIIRLFWKRWKVGIMQLCLM